MMTTLTCVACRRPDAVAMLALVRREGDPAPVCAGCFGGLIARVTLSAAAGCGGCAALRDAFEDLLDQMDRSALPIAANPQVEHHHCLLST